MFPNRIYYRDITSFLIDKDVIYVLSQITDPFSDIIEILSWTGFKAHLVEYSLQLQADDSNGLIFDEREISLEYSEGFSLSTLFRMSIMVGLILTTFGALATIGLILGSDSFLRSAPDWWTLTSAMFFIFCVQMGMVGVFGERLFRSLEKIRSRPAFIVDSIINPPISPSPEGREKIEKMILSLWSIRKQKIAYASSTSPVSSEDKLEE